MRFNSVSRPKLIRRFTDKWGTHRPDPNNSFDEDDQDQDGAVTGGVGDSTDQAGGGGSVGVRGVGGEGVLNRRKRLSWKLGTLKRKRSKAGSRHEGDERKREVAKTKGEDGKSSDEKQDGIGVDSVEPYQEKDDGEISRISQDAARTPTPIVTELTSSTPTTNKSPLNANAKNRDGFEVALASPTPPFFKSETTTSSPNLSSRESFATAHSQDQAQAVSSSSSFTSVQRQVQSPPEIPIDLQPSAEGVTAMTINPRKDIQTPTQEEKSPRQNSHPSPSISPSDPPPSLRQFQSPLLTLPPELLRQIIFLVAHSRAPAWASYLTSDLGHPSSSAPPTATDPHGGIETGIELTRGTIGPLPISANDHFHSTAGMDTSASDSNIGASTSGSHPIPDNDHNNTSSQDSDKPEAATGAESNGKRSRTNQSSTSALSSAPASAPPQPYKNRTPFPPPSHTPIIPSPHQTLLSLSLTCRLLRILSVPYLFSPFSFFTVPPLMKGSFTTLPSSSRRSRLDPNNARDHAVRLLIKKRWWQFWKRKGKLVGRGPGPFWLVYREVRGGMLERVTEEDRLQKERKTKKKVETKRAKKSNGKKAPKSLEMPSSDQNRDDNDSSSLLSRKHHDPQRKHSDMEIKKMRRAIMAMEATNHPKRAARRKMREERRRARLGEEKLEAEIEKERKEKEEEDKMDRDLMSATNLVHVRKLYLEFLGMLIPQCPIDDDDDIKTFLWIVSHFPRPKSSEDDQDTDGYFSKPPLADGPLIESLVIPQIQFIQFPHFIQLCNTLPNKLFNPLVNSLPHVTDLQLGSTVLMSFAEGLVIPLSDRLKSLKCHMGLMETETRRKVRAGLRNQLAGIGAAAALLARLDEEDENEERDEVEQSPADGAPKSSSANDDEPKKRKTKGPLILPKLQTLVIQVCYPRRLDSTVDESEDEDDNPTPHNQRKKKETAPLLPFLRWKLPALVNLTLVDCAHSSALETPSGRPRRGTQMRMMRKFLEEVKGTLQRLVVRSSFLPGGKDTYPLDDHEDSEDDQFNSSDEHDELNPDTRLNADLEGGFGGLLPDEDSGSSAADELDEDLDIENVDLPALRLLILEPLTNLLLTRPKRPQMSPRVVQLGEETHPRDLCLSQHPPTYGGSPPHSPVVLSLIGNAPSLTHFESFTLTALPYVHYAKSERLWPALRSVEIWTYECIPPGATPRWEPIPSLYPASPSSRPKKDFKGKGKQRASLDSNHSLTDPAETTCIDHYGRPISKGKGKRLECWVTRMKEELEEDSGVRVSIEGATQWVGEGLLASRLRNRSGKIPHAEGCYCCASTTPRI